MDAPGKKTGEEIVISGMSGRFPSSDNVVEFMENLYNKVDMVSVNQFADVDHPEVPNHFGNISGMNKFDAQFFRVPYTQAYSLDAMARKLLENTYCAMFDAGINPLEFKGRKLGVYTGSSYQDYTSTSLYEYSSAFKNDFIVSGSNKSMFPNRISFWCDGKGPSYGIDSSDASFTEALEKAYNDMKSGVVDAAIVNGCALCLLPKICVNIKRTGVLCLDGKTKCFDKKGDGYVRSEAVAVLFLQKAKDAKRIYAEVKHVKTCFGTHPDNNFLPKRKTEEIENFLTTFYDEAKVNPDEVEYVEGQGTALADADANELEAIGDIFGKQKPVMVGCVKSNMGNSEPAAGICAVTKLCLAYQKGVLPPNLHCDDPVDVSAVKNGQVQILTDEAPFERGYTAINNFSSTGVNGHILMGGYTKSKDVSRYKRSIPSLVCVSGRQDTSVEKIFNILKNQPLDAEQIGLLHGIHNIDTPGHTCRGYVILDTNEKGETVALSQGSELYQGRKRPLWFVYSGMGSQWASMGAELMKIPIFAAAIEKCHKVLEPKGIDLIRIITDPDKKVFDNILNCFVGITACQIGLTDVLKALNIVPDNMLGHSVGEIGCAYCDGGLSAEDTILASYTRGLISIESEFIKGSMAAVGLGFKDLEPLCPPEIDIACHNSHESSTISGPTDIIREFVKELASKNIFVKEVPCGNIAYHSRYVKKAAPAFQRGLQEVIKAPAKRSDKWICTSLPKERWTEPLALFSSAEYHANNFTSPVYFEESARLIPDDAILVEVAPHGLLQAILKRSHPNCAHIPLTRRGNSDPVKYLLEAFGKLYQEGFNPKIGNLYPQIEFPVSTGTPPISHFIEWHHEEHWPVTLHGKKLRIVRPCRQIAISLEDSEYQFITGNIREGQIVFPEAAIIFTLWETLAMYKGKTCEEMPVAFRDVQFHGEVILDPKKTLKLNFDTNKGNGYFEVSHGNVVVANGYVLESKSRPVEPKVFDKHDEITSDEIYGLLNTKGYFYTNDFQSIVSTNSEMNIARVKWNKNWSLLIDSMIQLNLLARNYAGTSVPKIIKYLDISTTHFDPMTKQTVSLSDQTYVNVHVEQFCGATTCAGIEMKEIIFEEKPLRSKNPQLIQRSSFMPYLSDIPSTIEDTLLLFLQIVAENVQEDIINVADFTVGTKFDAALLIDKLSDYIPQVKLNVNLQLAKGPSHLLVVHNITHNELELEKYLSNNKFIISLENSQEDLRTDKFQVISTRKVGNTIVSLFKNNVEEDVKFVPVIYDDKFDWLSRVHAEQRGCNKVVLIAEKKPQCGVKGLIKILKNQFAINISFVGVDGHPNPKLISKDIVNNDQLKKNLFVNILRNGQWGGFYHLPCQKTRTTPVNFTLVSDNMGLLDSLKWAEMQNERKTTNSVQVHYAGISLRDVEKATGLIKTKDNGFGMDFSGTDEKGRKVMGLVASGALASVVEPDPELVWPVPDQWTLEEAATVPFPYIFAYYCLFIKWHKRPGGNQQKVFITGGAGALGQAVISICLSMGLTVFTSVSNISKKKYLMKRFPELNENHIGCSREAGFHTVIAQHTNGEMCDLAINTYHGELREYVMKCLGFCGIFMDINFHDIQQNRPIGMYYLSLERTYMSANLSSIFKHELSSEKQKLRKLLTDGIARGVVKPISHIVFDHTDVTKAFRLLSSDKRKGRFLVKIKDHSASTKNTNVIPRISCSSNGAYVIICDNSNLGIELANRLVKRGARNLILHKKQSEFTQYLDAKLKMWHQLGVKVDIYSDNLLKDSNCEKLLKDKTNQDKVHGVFYIKPEANGFDGKDYIKYGNEITSIVNNLDIVTRSNCSDLRNFVIIARESNNPVDEYSTSVLENISQSRTEVGFPALLFRTEIHGEFQPTSDTRLLDLHTIDTTLNALESSLQQNLDNVFTHNVSKNKSSTFLNSVSHILGFNINNIDEDLTVGDLTSSVAVFEELRMLLKDVTNIEFTVETLKDLTLSRLKTLNIVSSKKITKFDSGLGAFFKFVDENEIDTSNILVPMLTSVERLVASEFELNSNGAYLMLIPGFEGHPNVFDPICERLKVRAVTCQLGPDATQKSIPDIALGIKKFLSTRFRMGTRFQILGYSFGVNVALEVAALLEKEGLVGLVYCLDSSPDALRVQMDAYIGKLSEDDLQDAVIEHMFSIMSGKSSDTIKIKLRNMRNWTEKVQLCLNSLRKYINYSAEYQRDVIESAYKRLILARNYNPNLKLESEIVLMRGVPHPKAEPLPHDYNLSKYTKKPVKVFDISSDFATAPEDCRVSNIVNHLLDPVLLEGLEPMHFCEAYHTAPIADL